MIDKGLRAISVVSSLLIAGYFVASCSLSPHDLPSVKSGVSADYEVTVEFDSVLNLPDGADVMMNGIQVGRVKELSESGENIDVVVQLTNSRPVEADTSAIIRQDTPLGDTYLALTPSDNRASGTLLKDGDTIPLEKTISPPTLEDTISVLAYFVNGGSIQRVQDAMMRLNQTLPDIADTRALAETVSKDIQDLGNDLSAIDNFLTGLDDVALSFVESELDIERIFSDEGIEYFSVVGYSLVRHIATLLPSVGSVFTGGLWLVPLLTSLAESAEMAATMRPDVQSLVDSGASFMDDSLRPFLADPNISVESVEIEDNNGGLTAGNDEILRLLGVGR